MTPATTTTPLDDLRELRRCLLSTQGMLEAICDHMPAGTNVSALRAHIEGGAPEMFTLIDRAIAGLGGPSRDDDQSCAKSMTRGYQVAVLMRREEATGERDPEAWRQDPDEFVDAYEPAAEPGNPERKTP